MPKTTSKKSNNTKLLRHLTANLSKKQLIIALVGIIVLTGTASAITFRAVDRNRAEKEQNRVLRTANIEDSFEDKEAAATAQATANQQSTPPTTSTSRAANISKTVSFTKGGAGLQGAFVVVNLTADSALNGTCYYSFTLGNSVFNTSSPSAVQSCVISIPLASFVKSGNWRFSLSYVSADGKTKGTGGGFDVAIVPEVRSINFTKGGAGLNGGVISASSNLSEVQSGTCTFTFSLNGSVRVTKTVGISNSNRCTVDIAQSEFPKSAIYSYSLSFISNDTLTIANQAAFDVEVL